jgi:hypothetical protein
MGRLDKQRRNVCLEYCHPAGIFAVVGTAVASNCKDPYPNGIPFRDRMTLKERIQNNYFFAS